MKNENSISSYILSYFRSITTVSAYMLYGGAEAVTQLSEDTLRLISSYNCNNPLTPLHIGAIMLWSDDATYTGFYICNDTQAVYVGHTILELEDFIRALLTCFTNNI